jgi:four helix bundle protein
MVEENKIKDFTDLQAWQNAHKLVLNVYKLTNNFPKSESFGLISQLQRASV